LMQKQKRREVKWEKMKKKCTQVQFLWRILNGLLNYRMQSKKDKDKKQENKRMSKVLQ